MEANINYLSDLVRNAIEENSQLEYKSAKAIEDTKSISIDVSSFANAAGGVIIYGIKEFDENEKKHLPEKLDPIDRVKYTREWLDSIIQSNIHPKIVGVTITPIQGESIQDVFYIVEIPQSTTAHQSLDKRYYRRYNTQKQPMDDYEIRDVMNRTKHPDISVYFDIEAPKSNHENFKLNIYLKNDGAILAKYCNYFVEVLSAVVDKEQHFGYRKIIKDNVEYFRIFGENTKRDLMNVELTGFTPRETYGPSQFKPILPGRKFFSQSIEIDGGFLSFGPKDIPICWEVYADNAPIKKGERIFNDLIKEPNSS